MIAVIYGTTGELIKLAPVLIALEARGQLPLTLCTGQQVEQIPPMLRDFGLPDPDVWLGRGHRGSDLERAAHIPGWLAHVAAAFAAQRRTIRRRLAANTTAPIVVVHGDTFTTVLGSLIGRALRVPIGHIEAGMRSGTIRNPFPEELNRRATARLATLHFAPNPAAVLNLRSERVGGRIVDTAANTIVDSLDLAGSMEPAVDVPDGPFGVVSLHRFELLERRGELEGILRMLKAAARRTPLLFIDHPITAAAIRAAGLDDLFDGGFRRIPRQRYPQFIALLRRSSFLVTDSGGSQEECAYLGHPCLVHRAVSEHATGLNGGSVVLSRMDLRVVESFLEDPHRHRIAPQRPPARPTDIIVQTLEERGHLASRPRLAA